MTSPQSISTPAERWQQLQTLFDQTMSMEPGLRVAFVLQACGDDIALRDQLLSLLSITSAHHENDVPQGDVMGQDDIDEDELPSGYIIGAYRIVRMIGQGGMGMVYLAERATTDFQQHGFKWPARQCHCTTAQRTENTGFAQSSQYCAIVRWRDRFEWTTISGHGVC